MTNDIMKVRTANGGYEVVSRRGASGLAPEIWDLSSRKTLIVTDSGVPRRYSEKIAEFFSEVSGYKYEETPTESGYAGYKDWFIDKYFRPGYTIEAGEGENPLPLAQFDEIYNDNEGILSGALALAAGAK